METINLALPEPLVAFVEERVAEGGYSTPSDYVGELIRKDRKRLSQDRLEELLVEGLDSGPPIEVNEEFWQQRRADLFARHSQESACDEKNHSHRSQSSSRSG